MPPEYDNTNRGSIWKNPKRESDRHPHLTGTANVDGTEYWISAWAKDKGGNPKAPELTFSFKAKDNQPVTETPPTADTHADDDDLPW
jgi:hypothetical protein|tara:strand:+ start:141 stop:401 length:261 start_codon:yes stop_codon:yes gene_type:complete